MSVVVSPKKRKRKTKRRESASDNAEHNDAKLPWYQTTWSLSLLSGLLLWLSFPPVGLWPLAWVAPIGWVVLIHREQLDGPKPYRTIWIAAFLHWLVLFQFVRIPHWGLYFGWFALSAYLAIYLPLFVGLSRVAVHRFGANPIVATAVVWVGLELARGHVASGISLALLGHSQIHWPAMIQIADLFGAYGISFVMMLVAACLANMIPVDGQRSMVVPALVAVGLIGVSLLYGNYRLNEVVKGDKTPKVNVALIQGSIDTVLDLTEEEADEYKAKIVSDYLRLTAEAFEKQPDLELVVWPEGKFPFTDLKLPESIDIGRLKDEAREEIEEVQMNFDDAVNELLIATRGEKPFRILVGAHAVRLKDQWWKHYNAALLIDERGRIDDHYYKMHRVPFGEYVYFGDWVPWLYQITPIPAPINPGEEAKAFEVGGMTFSPNICFESTVPHLISRQLDQLDRDGKQADVIVNISDDGWFFGSSCLDHHLACSRLRTIEHRTPMVVAANTGFSAWIDGNGQLLACGPRRKEAVLYAEVYPDSRQSLYQTVGDWPAFVCLVFCFVCAFVGIWNRRNVAPHK